MDLSGQIGWIGPFPFTLLSTNRQYRGGKKVEISRYRLIVEVGQVPTMGEEGKGGMI
jgi:hypothetical protein